jgi:hypothetical protein
MQSQDFFLDYLENMYERAQESHKQPLNPKKGLSGDPNLSSGGYPMRLATTSSPWLASLWEPSCFCSLPSQVLRLPTPLKQRPVVKAQPFLKAPTQHSFYTSVFASASPSP